jgi:transmembrane sensor
MKEESFWLLVSLKLSGEASPEELDMLERLLAEHPELQPRLEALGDWYSHAAPSRPGMKKGALQRHLQRLHLQQPLPSRRRGGRRLFLLAAGIAASIAGLGFFIYPLLPKKATPPVAQNSVSTKPGSKSKIQLPDGSQVWLNADSRLIYGEGFQGNAREVQLCGEAYFDVAKDARRPFIIHTRTIDVLVLGTSLNVRSYANEKNTEAVLIHGSVQISLHDDPNKKIILRPNDKLVVPNNNLPPAPGGKAPATPKDEDTARVLALRKAHFKGNDSVATEVLWMKNKLAFDKESLEDVALRLERWFNVKLTITNQQLKQTEYSGVFEYETLPQVMEALRLTGNFHYSIRRGEVTIRP